jgi:hypothetical protein
MHRFEFRVRVFVWMGWEWGFGGNAGGKRLVGDVIQQRPTHRARGRRRVGPRWPFGDCDGHKSEIATRRPSGAR